MKTNLIIIAVIMVLFSSCRERIDLELNDSASVVVIEGVITNQTAQHEIRVSKSLGYLDVNSVPAVTNASVKISDGDNVYYLTHTGNGIYKTIPEIAGVVGKTYTLTVEVDGKVYTAQEILQAISPIDSLVIDKAYMPIQPGVIWEDGKSYYNLGLYCQEPGNEQNYYMFDAYKNGELVSDTITEKFFSDDYFLNGSYIQGMNVYQVNAEMGDTLMIRMSSVSKEFYLYLMGLANASMAGSPFSGAPSNIKGNISNGALGFFRASGISDKQGIVLN